MNVRQIWEETVKQLEKVYDRREAENISYILFEDQFQVSKSDILLDDKKTLDQPKLHKSIERLLASEPIQYVTGITEFYGRNFEIQPGVLIPRPETEELVDLILKANAIETPKILDLGVGSGCIAISLALETRSSVFATDVSKEAIHIAKRNASRLNAEVSFIQHDILSSNLPFEGLDILVSNPPYIPASDEREMHANVLDFEPDLALFVPNDDPLIFYLRIGEEGLHSLKEGGCLYFEIHEKYGLEIKQLLESQGYRHVVVHKDMQGKDRMISAINSANR